MKFQNPSFKFLERTHGRLRRNQYASLFFKVGGIKRKIEKKTTLCRIYICITVKSKGYNDIVSTISNIVRLCFHVKQNYYYNFWSFK